MTYTFNLLDQPWIPCLTTEGKFVEVSLYELLVNAHQLREITCETPLMTAALYPMTLALLHRVVEGPADDGVWEQLWKQGAFSKNAIETYMNRWYDRFDLFHPEYPFYQAKDDRVSPKSMIHLIHSIGNTGTLFTHDNEEVPPGLPPAESARHLLTAQAFRTAGLSGLKEKFTDSPFTRGVLFWAGGADLFEVFMLNLIAYPGSPANINYTPSDAPIWEQETPFKERTYPYGYLDYLTWPSNRILLIPDTVDNAIVVNRMTVAPGLNINAAVRSPQKRYTVTEEKNGEQKQSFMYFNEEKALWRSYHSLIALRSKGIHPPAVVEWFNRLVPIVLDDTTVLQLTATGMLAKQAKPIFYRQEQLPLPLSLLGDMTKAAQIQQAIEVAEAVDSQLYFAVKALAERLLKRGGESTLDSNDIKRLIQQWDVKSLYWAQTEPDFWRFVHSVAQGDADASVQWQIAIIRNARNALEAAKRMSGTSAAALHGQVEAEHKLNVGISKVFKSEEEA